MPCHVDVESWGCLTHLRYGIREVDLPRSQAQTRSIELVEAYAEADQAT